MSCEKEPLGRRHFLRSLFGLGTLVEANPRAQAKPSVGRARFFWCDLRTGQIGFPTGQTLPAGRPGSVMKLVASAAALESHACTPETTYECRGTYNAGPRSVHCLFPHGVVDLPHALGLSCNVYFAQLAEKLGPKLVLGFASRFGLGSAVGGFLPGKFPEQEEPYSINYVLGLADGLEPTSLELLRLAALVGTRGSLPYLHSAEAPDPAGQRFLLELSGQTWAVLNQGMQIAAREGTGKKLDPANKLHVALKTGTVPHGKAFESWVCGFFPWTAPRYAFCLRSPSGTSYDEAVPALRQFLFGTEWP